MFYVQKIHFSHSLVILVTCAVSEAVYCFESQHISFIIWPLSKYDPAPGVLISSVVSSVSGVRRVYTLASLEENNSRW